MPVARLTGWRIRAGTVSSASLTSSYGVEILPMQSDQDFSTPWTINSKASQPLTLTRTVITADQSKKGDGALRWSWHLDYMTNGMLNYWLTTFISGVTFVSSAQSGPVTAMTYDEFDSPVFINALMYLPTLGEAVVGGWKDVEWPFEAGVLAA